MSHADSPAVFTRHVDEAITQFRSDRDRHKRLALPLKVSTSALGAGATILLGWQNLTQSLAEWVDAKQSKP